MIRTTTIVLAFGLAAASFPADAQLSKLRNMVGGSSSSDASASAVPDEAAQEALVQTFVNSQSHSLRAQASFAQAFGLAEQVQLLEAERLALTSGSVSTDDMRKARSVSESVQAALDERQAQQPELTGEARTHYTQGLVALAESLLEARKLSGEASNFTSGMSNLGPAQLATVGRKLVAGAWVAKESPGYVRGLYNSSKSAFTFARAANIDVPANADSMLDALD